MAKKTKTYPLYIALLLCFFQVAGIDVYAQEPVKVSQDSISPEREAPKARARRHREPVVSTPATDSVKVEKAVVLPPIDSLENLKPAIVTADSLEEVNRQNLERIETPVMPSVVKADSLPPVMPKKLFVPNPTKATWYAIVFPGGGQIYNRKYWKLPIIYGGFAGCAYALSWNGKMYKDYAQAYMDIMDNNPNTNSFQDLLPPNHNYTDTQLKDLLRKRKDTYRRYRDLSIFAVIGVYLISIIDAYVDAELSNFDISPDLSMRVEPTIINNNPLQPGSKSVGVQCSLRF